MDIFSKRLGLALAISLVAVACASPTIPNQGGGDDEDSSDPSESASTKKATPKKTTAPSSPAGSDSPSGGDNKTTTPPGTPSTPQNPSPSTPPAPGGSCSASADGEACFNCCDQASGGDLGKADDAFGACACEPGGQCATACGATFCNGQEPSAACDTCLTQKCDPIFEAACTSAACKAGEQCLDTSCADKQ